MISAGHFLMFYIGIELATIPIAALSAYDRYRNNSAEAGIKLISILGPFIRNSLIRAIDDLRYHRYTLFPVRWLHT